MSAWLEDRMAIEDLIARYNQSLDYGDYEAYLACWCDDAIFEGLGLNLVGTAAIRTFTDSYNQRYRLRLNALKHFTVNIHSVIDGDEAMSSSYLQLLTTGDKGAYILFTGRYHDKLRRVGGQWRFAHRRMVQDMPRVAAPVEG